MFQGSERKIITLDELTSRYNELSKMNIDEAVKKVLRENVVCFHSPDDENAFLTNWCHTPFEVDCIKFDSMEQYMMYTKAKLFDDKEIMGKVLKTTDFGEVKALGRKVRNFDDRTWNEYKEGLIYKGLYAKFTSTDELKQKLLATGNKILTECAVKDHIWANGVSIKSEDRFYPVNWRGQNILGKLIMKVRGNIREKE
jgi:hypothetical protein